MCTLLLALFLSTATAAEKYSYPAQRITVKGATDIKIVGVRGHLKLHGNPRAKSLSLKVQHSKGRKFEDWHLSVERRGKTIFLEVFNTAYGRQWRHQIEEGLWPEFDIELEGAALPATVAWREGALDFKNWNAPLEVSFLKGEARVAGGKGPLTLAPVEATLALRGHEGPVKIKGQSGAVTLAGMKGDLELNWLNGKIALEQCRGDLRVETRAGEVNVRGGGGELNLRVAKGHARVDGFHGAVHGQGDQAEWEVAAAAPSDVNIMTSTGPVGVIWRTGGAKVFLTSTRGKIDFPRDRFLKIGDREGRRVVEGVRSSKSMGQVFVRTESGAISWR